MNNSIYYRIKILFFVRQIYLNRHLAGIKIRFSDNPMASVTSLMLIIAAFTCNLTEEKIRECMESVKISDIKKWSNDEIGMILHKQRSTLLSNEYKNGTNFF